MTKEEMKAKLALKWLPQDIERKEKQIAALQVELIEMKAKLKAARRIMAQKIVEE